MDIDSPACNTTTNKIRKIRRSRHPNAFTPVEQMSHPCVGRFSDSAYFFGLQAGGQPLLCPQILGIFRFCPSEPFHPLPKGIQIVGLAAGPGHPPGIYIGGGHKKSTGKLVLKDICGSIEATELAVGIHKSRNPTAQAQDKTGRVYNQTVHHQHHHQNHYQHQYHQHYHH